MLVTLLLSLLLVCATTPSPAPPITPTEEFWSDAEAAIEPVKDAASDAMDDAITHVEELEDPCFPSSATVTRADGTRSPVDALKEGDVIVAVNVDGHVTMDTVSLLSIAQPDDEEVSLINLTTTHGKSLLVTPGHHIAVGSSCCAELQLAKDVNIGATVFLLEQGTLKAQVISKIAKLVGKGRHSPVLTNGGLPLIDSFATSPDSMAKVRPCS